MPTITHRLPGMLLTDHFFSVPLDHTDPNGESLSVYAREVLTTDPFVTVDPDLLPFDEVVERSDLLILCTPHKAYQSADLKGKPVVDVWGMLEGANLV